jgi:heat shock protein HslJ
MKKYPLLTILVLMTLCFSCNAAKDTAKTSKNPTQLEGQVWQIENWVSNDKVRKLNTLEPISILFTDTTKQINGSDGCNRFFANYTLEGKELIVKISGGTKKYCGEESAKDEQYFWSFLQSKPIYKIHKEKLILESKTDIITFNPQK